MLILFYFFLRKHRFARFCFMFYTPGFGNFRGEIDFFLLFEIMEFFGKLRVMISRVGGKLWWRDILRKINIRGWDSLHFYDCSKNCHVWKNYFFVFFHGQYMIWTGLILMEQREQCLRQNRCLLSKTDDPSPWLWSEKFKQMSRNKV